MGTVPPSIVYSVPVIEDARSGARNAIRSATSSGFAGRPSGMPPSASMMIFLPPSRSVPACLASARPNGLRPPLRSTRRHPHDPDTFGRNFLRYRLAVSRKRCFCRCIRGRRFRKRHDPLDGCHVHDHPASSGNHVRDKEPIKSNSRKQIE